MYNNYKKIKKLQIVGFFWIIIIGSLLHFSYEWSGNLPIVGTFSAVNESVWEHLKLGYFALLFFILIEYWFVKDDTNSFFLAKTVGIVAMNLFIVVVFYTYTWITKKPILFIDIGSFVVGAIICQIISFKILKIEVSRMANKLGLIIFILLGCAFVLFTFNPPRLPIFMDSRTKKYGI